jgi:hypothetical protein
MRLKITAPQSRPSPHHLVAFRPIGLAAAQRAGDAGGDPGPVAVIAAGTELARIPAPEVPLS